MNQRTSYSTHQVARIVGVSSPTVIKWCNDGLLDCFRTPGGHRRISATALQIFASRHNYPLQYSSKTERTTDKVSKQTIDIVDSDLELGEMIKEYIEQEHQYVVHLAEDIQMAGLLIGYHSPKLVVIDMNRTKHHGVNLMRQVQSIFGVNGIRFISYSAFFNPKTNQLDKDFDAFILKTEPISSLFKAIEKVMRT